MIVGGIDVIRATSNTIHSFYHLPLTDNAYRISLRDYLIVGIKNETV